MTAPSTHASVLFLCEEIVGVSGLTTPRPSFPLEDTSLTGPLGSQVCYLMEGERGREGGRAEREKKGRVREGREREEGYSIYMYTTNA